MKKIKKAIYIVSILLIIFILIALFYFFKIKNEIIYGDVGNKYNETKVEEIKEPTKEELSMLKAEEKLKEMTLNEKISQLLLVRFPSQNVNQITSENCFGGYVFFEKDFKNKTLEQAKEMIDNVQRSSKIPLITAVDEEGGTVVRISNNKNLSPNKFKSPSELYNEGGFDLIIEDTKVKSNILNSVGINLNLAPVIDIANASDYMYNRTLKQNVELTSQFAKTVIETSKETKVSYTLKHFPGYGHNSDTHKMSSLDTRTYEEIMNTAIPPFEAGIKAGAEAILISHNIIECIDQENPASISLPIHELLRKNLNFNGIIITDDLSMNATANIENIYEKAVLAGNNLLITSNYDVAISQINNAIINSRITEEQINELVVKTIAWKYYKNLMV